MTKKRQNPFLAPVSVEHSTEEEVVSTDGIVDIPEQEPETEVEDKGYRIIRTDRIQNLAVGEKYKREDKKNCKIWTVVLKDEGKMLVSSSPKNIHNPRKEADLEVVVIELT